VLWVTAAGNAVAPFVTAGMTQKSPVIVTAGMFLAMVSGMTSFVSFPALLPTFQSEWGLSASSAGWISGVFFAGYVATVPVLSALTDRFDPRRIFLAGMFLMAAATLGFGLLATGAVSASLWRLLQGIGFASTYMPGLKAVGDAVPDDLRDRSAAFYTATFTSGAAFSFLVTGELAAMTGWRAVFVVLALGPLLGALLAWFVLVFWQVTAAAGMLPAFDPRMVLANRRVLSYMLAYCTHNAESSAMRAWIVGFLAFVQARAGTRSGANPAFDPATVAALVNIAGLPAVILANEVARRFDRRITIIVIMIASSLVGFALTGVAEGPVIAVLGLLIAYGVLVPADSGAINAGLLEACDPANRGKVLGLHAVLGFGGAFLGPVVFGFALDLGGGTSDLFAWITAFSCFVVLAAAGSLALWRWS